MGHPLPRSIGNLTELSHLDLSYNQLSRVPSAIGRLKKLRVLALRDNQLLSISKEIGQLEALKELHLQGNQLRFLPPEVSACAELAGNEGAAKLHDNPWVLPIADNLKLGVNHVFRYVGSTTYRTIYDRHHDSGTGKNRKQP